MRCTGREFTDKYVQNGGFQYNIKNSHMSFTNRSYGGGGGKFTDKYLKNADFDQYKKIYEFICSNTKQVADYTDPFSLSKQKTDVSSV